MTREAVIHDVSDTALWSAAFRARETARPDALFVDPFAQQLAGERGLQIAKALPFHEKNAWSWVTRTYLFDRIIRRQIERGVDTVVNLAAGLDARPYRMALPASLRWIEVDFPQILEYKTTKLSQASPSCTLERVGMDLADAQGRRDLFGEIGKKATDALVISEGLVVYLSADEVGALARDLADQPSFRHWVVDLASPGLLTMLRKTTIAAFGADVPDLQFAPAEGPQFFARFGWKPIEVHSTLKTAAGLRRLRPLFALFAVFPEDPVRSPSRPWSGTCLFERTGAG